MLALVFSWRGVSQQSECLVEIKTAGDTVDPRSGVLRRNPTVDSNRPPLQVLRPFECFADIVSLDHESEQEKLSLIQAPSRIKRFASCPGHQLLLPMNCCALTALLSQRRRLFFVRVGTRLATNVSER